MIEVLGQACSSTKFATSSQLGALDERDARWLAPLDGVGLEAGRSTFTAAQLEAAGRGEELGMRHIRALAPEVHDARRILGTRETLGDGDRDWFAEGTYLGQWGLPPVEAVYTKKDFDATGGHLDGSDGRTYATHVPRPDVTEFWSLTVYGSDDRLMAHNALNRHSRGDRTLRADPDGGYTIRLGADVEAGREDPNFLPIPEKEFYVILRLYGPDEEMQRGAYEMAEIVPSA